MHKTIFDTPVIREICYGISKAYTKLFGWETVGGMPSDPKCVMIAAPHTTNWDMPIMMFHAFVLRARVYWVGKKELFRFPFGGIMKWLGGIPVDRSKSNNMVDATIDEFNKAEKLVIIIPPEGTRGDTHYWKTGFYHIANGAGVPIVCGFLDYSRKTGGIGPLIRPTGDIDADMDKLKGFYAQIKGKYPDKFCRPEVHHKSVPEIKAFPDEKDHNKKQRPTGTDA